MTKKGLAALLVGVTILIVGGKYVNDKSRSLQQTEDAQPATTDVPVVIPEQDMPAKQACAQAVYQRALHHDDFNYWDQQVQSLCANFEIHGQPIH